MATSLFQMFIYGFAFGLTLGVMVLVLRFA